MHVRSHHLLRLALAATLSSTAVPAAHAQLPEKFENLQVFPRDVPRPELIQRMREFSLGLGVRCEHCHAEPAEGVANRFALDVKPTKTQARAMLRMLATINGTLLPQLPSHATPAVKVDCVTCHRGLPIPKTLQTTLFELATTDSAAAAVARYRELRNTMALSGSYDFGEWEINELARRLSREGKIAAAITMLEMNAEFYPKSVAIDVLVGELYLKRGDKDMAVARFRAALQKEPDNERAQFMLKQVEGKP